MTSLFSGEDETNPEDNNGFSAVSTQEEAEVETQSGTSVAAAESTTGDDAGVAVSGLLDGDDNNKVGGLGTSEIIEVTAAAATTAAVSATAAADLPPQSEPDYFEEEKKESDQQQQQMAKQTEMTVVSLDEEGPSQTSAEEQQLSPPSQSPPDTSVITSAVVSSAAVVSGYTVSEDTSTKASAAKMTEQSADDRPEIVKLRNIHKTYLLGLEGVPALRGVSLSIRRGEFIVILGKSGCGKTSMLNVMGTIDKATKGDLYICGHRIAQSTTDSEVASLRLKHIGFCFQTFNLISSMTALENVELPMILNGTLGSGEIRERAKKLLSDLGMGHRFDHVPAELSGGEQQRVTIARAISNEPSLLLLDEPTGDLDSKNSDLVMSILLRLNREQQMTCVFVTHDVAIKNFAHRVIHMLDGKVARIEVIPEKVRQETLAELEQNVTHQKKTEVVKPTTEVRDPRQFYHFHRWADENHHKKKRLFVS